jgi:hypothetical protein
MFFNTDMQGLKISEENALVNLFCFANPKFQNKNGQKTDITMPSSPLTN